MAKTKQYYQNAYGQAIREDLDGTAWIYKGKLWERSPYYEEKILRGETGIREISEEQALQLIAGVPT